MTQDEIIEMARQSGWTDDLLEVSFVSPMLERFANLVAAKLFNEKKHWVGLTDEQIWQIATDSTIGGDLHADKFANAIEAKLKERNT